MGIGSEYFVVYLLCVYICYADYVELPVILYLLFSVWYITCCPDEKKLWNLHRVIVEVLVLGLLVVVYEIPYSSCM